jgi:hypothetical protein
MQVLDGVVEAAFVADWLCQFADSQISSVWNGELPIHDVSLPPDNLERPSQEQYLRDSHQYQEQIESPIAPVCQVSLGGVYRQGGKFADSYGMLCIFGMSATVIGLGGLRLELELAPSRVVEQVRR